MFVKDMGINGFLDKQLLKNQKSALNAKALIGICLEKVRKNDYKRASKRRDKGACREI